MCDRYELVFETNIGNYYGSVVLLKDREGNHWIGLGEPDGTNIYGPLTPQQVAAMEAIKNVDYAERDGEIYHV